MTVLTELKIPGEPAYLSLLEAFVADAARRAELGDPERESLVTAARLGFEAIVEQALVDDPEPIHVVASRTPHALSVGIFERGLPIADERARREPRWSQILAHVDEAHWHAHGTHGSELRLIVERPHGMPVLDAHPRPDAADDVPLAPEQTYTIRRFEPADAEGVARAFYLTYGYHYDLPAVYVPARLIELNAQGRYVSIVAAGEDGDIAGHYALAIEPGEPIADAGGAVVVPAHRGRDLLNRMRRFAEEEARRLGLAAYFSEPVTDHTRTQQASMKFGATACGITLGLSPRSFVAKHMELSTTSQRQSFMLYVRPLGERERRTIYAPPQHRAMIERIYGQLGLPVQFGDAAAQRTSERGVVKTGIVRADNVATIAVQRIGPDTAGAVRQALEDLQAVRHLAAAYLWLPLEDPGTPALCTAAEKLGLFFSGVGPWMLEGGRDSLRMQMPLTPIDLSGLTVIGDLGRDLLAYIEAERNRVASLRLTPPG